VQETPQQRIEDSFKKLTSREDITILLISQQAANEIRHLLDTYDQMLPTILEIPTPAHPYDMDKDSTMHRINRLLGAQ
jgi:V-type H+-transporting ATPase subunit F